MHIIFYEKPGCGGNAKQRAWLEAAGHTLDRRSLLDEPWIADSLLPYLRDLPVALWFNKAAPRLKSGEIQPESVSADEALKLLLAEHLLIRRPLMQLPDGKRMVGFETAEVERFLGSSPSSTPSTSTSMEGCAAASPMAACKPGV